MAEGRCGGRGQRSALALTPDMRRLRPSLAASLSILASAYFGYALIGQRSESLPFDAEHFYFPMAHRLVEAGPVYLLSPDSVRSTPVSYIWPALFGIDAAALHIAHVVVGVALCLIAFDTVRRASSPWAGAIAAWCLALSPLLGHFVAQPATEAPFLLFTAVWWWGLVAYVQGRSLFLIPAVIGGSLSILTRQVWLYPVLLLILALTALWLLRKGQMATRMLIVHALILVVPALVVLKNYAVADHAVVATGAGSALYFGQHPFTGGFEPPLIGLNYDEGAVLSVLDVDHKSPLGDKVLTAIGLEWLRERPFLDSMSELPTRIGRVLFLPNLGLAPTVFNSRALRIATICLALIGLVAQRRNPLAVLLAAGLAAQALQLSVLLFNERYSVGTLDYGLVLLASVGLVSCVRPAFATDAIVARAPSKPSWLRVTSTAAVCVAIALLCVASISLGYWIQRFTPLEAARLPRDRALVRALGPQPPLLVRAADGAEGVHDGEIMASNSDMLLRLAITPLHPKADANVMWLIRMSTTPPPGKRCRRATLTFLDQGTETTRPARALFLRDDGLVHDYVIGAHSATSSVFPRGEGELHLRFECGVGTRVRVADVIFYDSRIPEVYAPHAKDIAKRLR